MIRNYSGFPHGINDPRVVTSDRRRRMNGPLSLNVATAHADHDAPDQPVLHSPADGRRHFRNRLKADIVCRSLASAMLSPRH